MCRAGGRAHVQLGGSWNEISFHSDPQTETKKKKNKSKTTSTAVRHRTKKNKMAHTRYNERAMVGIGCDDAA